MVRMYADRREDITEVYAGNIAATLGLNSAAYIARITRMSIVEALGAELDSVVISDLRDHTYFAKLRVRQDGEIIEIDSRPSDAIAVASCQVPLSQSSA